jgi:Flp pilus assembly pilin Flp
MTILSELWADDQGKDIVEYALMLVALLAIVIGTIMLGRR